MKIKTKINLGDVVKDKITGFTGTVTGFCTYITGCNQFLVVPKCDKPHIKVDGHWFDEARLEYCNKSEIPEKLVGETNGCDIPAPMK